MTFGWQWVPGYWGVVNQQNPQFLPAPPQSVEEGPSAPAPNAPKAPFKIVRRSIAVSPIKNLPAGPTILNVTAQFRAPEGR